MSEAVKLETAPALSGPVGSAWSGRWLALLAATLGGAVVVLLVLVAAYGANVDAPTVALSVAAAALIHALARLYAVVRALAGPDRMAAVGRGAGSFTQAELRDEKRRLLRAIKELEFDHGMGKLSQADYDAVIATYRLRAIEVMRALEGGQAVHPELAKLLAERGAPGEAREAAAGPDEVPVMKTDTPMPGEPTPGHAKLGPLDATTRICALCNGMNDSDARFCKYCGGAMKKERSAPRRGAPAAISGEIGGPG
jgi:hypothetical protein